MTKAQNALDDLISPVWRDTDKFVEVDKGYALSILDEVEKTLDFEDDDFEWSAMRALLDYYGAENDKVLIMAVTGRRIDRANSGDKSGLSILGTATRDRVVNPPRSLPALVLLQQEGSAALNWAAGRKFWWPVLAAPATAEPCVFASKVAA
jgi:hypothetical protein